MEYNKGGSDKGASQEVLRHSPNEIVIGLTKSPKGRPCIGMTFEGNEWIFYTTKTPILADKIRQQLQQDYEMPSLPGLPFDFRASIEQQKLVLFEEDPSGLNKPVGIFVPADRFDNLVIDSIGT